MQQVVFHLPFVFQVAYWSILIKQIDISINIFHFVTHRHVALELNPLDKAPRASAR